jgi:hypothetical protein
MENNTREIKLKNIFTYKISFSDNFIEKNGCRIFFDEVNSIRCKKWKQYANYFGSKAFHGNFNRIFIEDNRKNKLDLKFSSENEDSFYLHDYIISKISKFCADSMIKNILRGQEIKISNLLLTQRGVYKRRFGRGIFLSWEDCGKVVIDRGFVKIFKGNDKKFTSMSTWKRNAIVLPEIVNICIEYSAHK